MDLKLFALDVCLLIGSACTQDNRSLYTGVGSNLNSTEIPRLDVPLQNLIDDASDDSSISMLSGNYVLSEPLHISKNITLTGYHSVCQGTAGPASLVPRCSKTYQIISMTTILRFPGGIVVATDNTLAVEGYHLVQRAHMGKEQMDEALG